MSEAGRLLLESPLPIKAIADRLGFSDVHFFTRQFRQFLGVPPATFRHNLREHD
jgi:AraC-like DNA-binding protein